MSPWPGRSPSGGDPNRDGLGRRTAARPSRHGTEPGEDLPLGPAQLAWSFNRDGEADPELIEARDREMGISTARVRAARAGLQALAHPQAGVDALHGRFDRPTREIPGVVEGEPAPAGADRSRSADPARPEGDER